MGEHKCACKSNGPEGVEVFASELLETTNDFGQKAQLISALVSILYVADRVEYSGIVAKTLEKLEEVISSIEV